MAHPVIRPHGTRYAYHLVVTQLGDGATHYRLHRHGQYVEPRDTLCFSILRDGSYVADARDYRTARRHGYRCHFL